MKEKFLSIVNFGIKPETSPEIAEQIRLVNGISFTGVPISITYMLIFGITGYYPLVAAFSLGILVFILRRTSNLL